MKFCDESCEHCCPEKNYCTKYHKSILPYNRCIGEMKPIPSSEDQEE